MKIKKGLIIIYLIITTLIYPIESIGFSKYITNIVSDLKNNKVNKKNLKTNIIYIVLYIFLLDFYHKYVII